MYPFLFRKLKSPNNERKIESSKSTNSPVEEVVFSVSDDEIDVISIPDMTPKQQRRNPINEQRKLSMENENLVRFMEAGANTESKNFICEENLRLYGFWEVFFQGREEAKFITQISSKCSRNF